MIYNRRFRPYIWAGQACLVGTDTLKFATFLPSVTEAWKKPRTFITDALAVHELFNLAQSPVKNNAYHKPEGLKGMLRGVWSSFEDLSRTTKDRRYRRLESIFNEAGYTRLILIVGDCPFPTLVFFGINFPAAVSSIKVFNPTCPCHSNIDDPRMLQGENLPANIAQLRDCIAERGGLRVSWRRNDMAANSWVLPTCTASLNAWQKVIAKPYWS